MPARPMSRVALATSAELPELWAGDRLFLDALRCRGFDANPVVWNDAAARWDQWDAVIIRSCWDYHLKVDAFRAWLHHLEQSDAVVINRPDLLRWNLHKDYLLEVQRAGGRIPPTLVIPRGARGSLRDHLCALGCATAVIKPAVSASGHSTRLVSTDVTGEDERAFEQAIAAGDVLAQAYVPQVRDCGEWSLVFFEGAYSHAALKRAAPGEFRVHIEWGGTVESAVPPSALVADAQRLLDRLDLGAVYARVDGTEVDGRLMVMELEVIEPELFFDRHPDAAARLVAAVERVLESRA
jgi:glutathione synthase/RimK-type ligase-like ATP-grasp enzyme